MRKLDLCHDTVQEYSPREYEINTIVKSLTLISQCYTPVLRASAVL